MKQAILISVLILFAWPPMDAGDAAPSIRMSTVSIGDGIPDGLGATLARLFVKLSEPSSDPSSEVRLELLLSSNLVSVDPAHCSQPSTDPCEERGKGIAGVAGYPTAFSDPVMALKLAGALYLPEGSMLVSNQDVRGYSLEVALEGALYAATSAAAGSSARLHLSTGTPAKLTAWGADDSTTPQRREYQNGTGTGVLLGDVQSALFPGWVEGEVVENSGSTLFVRVTEMDLATAKWSGTVQRVALLPDHESAEEAGLPAGTFGCLEVNYSGFPTESLILPQVTSNDVEIHAIAEPRRARFLRGDCNGDGDAATGIAEAIFFLLYSFQGGEKPPCFAACDFDGDGDVFTQVTDIIYLLRHYFMGGDPLPEPYPECGVEPEPSTVSCDTEPGCG